MKKKAVILTGLFFAAIGSADASSQLSSYDRQIVAGCMVLEAGCDGTDGMQAVLNVILNRAGGYLHRMVPETIKRGAFSCMSSVWNNRTPDYSPLIRKAQNQPRAYAKALQLIRTMEQGRLWDNTYGATHYHATSIRPYWVSDMSYLTTVGGHHFYTDAADRLAAM